MTMRRQGLSYERIGAALGISMQAAHAMVKRVLERTIAETGHAAKEVVELELQRIDELFTIARREAKLGSFEAMDRAIKLMERRAKLLGLDAASKTELSGKNGGPIETVARVVVLPELNDGTVGEADGTVGEAGGSTGAEADASPNDLSVESS